MPWSDRIGEAVATFRGIEIHLERTSQTPGRRVEVYEYPLRDQPYAEDLGRNKREWQVEGFLIGPDYDLARQRLVEAAETPGAGELVHPYYGTHQVVLVGGMRIRESTREGGIARVSFTVVRADDEPRLPRVTQDTQRQVQRTVAEAEQAVLDDFEENFNILELATDRVAAIETGLQNALRGIESAVGDVTGPISELIRSPAELGAQILESIATVRDLVNEPGRALGVYDDLFSAGDEPPVTSPLDPVPRQLQMAAIRAGNNLVRRAAVLQSAQVAAATDWLAADDAIAARDTITAGIELQLTSDFVPANDVYASLTAVRAAVVRDLEQRGAQLPRLRSVTLQQPLPALVVAQKLYGDAGRADELISRNRVAHPGRVPAGEALEVLGE
ncbi:DNA circularization N-terminal domain-containing protein [Marinobacter sp. KM021]|uniref:DNA circularization protein n=1 Tax=Marinobacter sp. KM021 TaxID=3075616 RepID=UPI003D6B4615